MFTAENPEQQPSPRHGGCWKTEIKEMAELIVEYEDLDTGTTETIRIGKPLDDKPTTDELIDGDWDPCRAIEITNGPGNDPIRGKITETDLIALARFLYLPAD